MKSTLFKKRTKFCTVKAKKSISVKAKKSISDMLKSAKRRSAYAFVASLGVWLPRAQAATVVNLDATGLPVGDLATWSNTGTDVGDFISAGAVTPAVTNVDGVHGVALTGADTHYAGPVPPAAVTGAGARTVEAWVFNPDSQDEEVVFAWGQRGGDGLNNSFGVGANTGWGAVAMWGDPDIGWGNSAAQVATNRVLGRWTYIVQSFDGTTNRVYVDGRLANQEGPPATGLINTEPTSPFRVGAQTAGDGTPSATGAPNLVVGRVRVSDFAMDSASISNQFNLEKSDFNLKDTDGDGMPDWWEVRYGLDKNDATGINGASGDKDGDGSSNIAEFQKGTNPSDSDSDDDGVSDGAETGTGIFVNANDTGSNPLSADTDSDGLSDGVETGTGIFVSASNTGSNPNKGDTDGDIASDGFEVTNGTDPNNPSSTPSLTRAIDLDATSLPLGALTNWINTGTIVGNFMTPTNATAASVVTADGVKGVALLLSDANNGTYYVGPGTPADLAGASPRTIEAWVYNPTPQGEEVVFAWGERGTTAENWSFGDGTDPAFGAVAIWGDPDIGWNDNEIFGRWTHIAATYDGTTTRVYSDGVLANSEVIGISTRQFDDSSNPLPFRVGRQNTPGGGIDGTGLGEITIAKIRVYTNALDAATIKARFDSEKGSFGLNDTDGDGLPDWYEIKCGLDKNDATGVNGANGDKDGDGLTNLQEYQLGTTQFPGGTRADKPDTDGDHLSDFAELNRVDIVGGVATTNVAPTDPLNPDTDGDGLPDGDETDTGVFVSPTSTGSDPLKRDSDGDTYSDGSEVGQGSDPNNSAIIPSPSPRIELIATNLPSGPLTSWTNSGTFQNGFAFISTNATPPIVQTVKGVQAVRFAGPAGSGSFFRGPTNAAAASLTGNPVYSIEAWIHNESPAVGGDEVVFAWGKRGASTPDGANAAFEHSTAGFGCEAHWGAPDFSWGGAANVIQDRWTYVVYTYNGVTSVQTAYVDGVQVNQVTNAAPLIIGNLGDGNQDLPFLVGAQNNANGTPSRTGRATGLSIGELRVFSRILNPTEIANNFASGAILYGTGDQDGDGMPDWFERQYPFLDEHNPNDASLDQDGDGLSNGAEYQNSIFGVQNSTDPSNPDTDGDGISDGAEVSNGTNPNNADTDRDGVPDGVEAALGTSSFIVDTDGDGFSDSVEVLYGSNPNDSGSQPDMSTPLPFVNLDATTLPIGPLSAWTNNNALGWSFIASTNTLSVGVVDGSKGITFNGPDSGYYTGPNMPVSWGGNAARTVEAWVFNPSAGDQETVFSWGMRGANNRNSAFSHGRNALFGAEQFWGPGDFPFGTNSTQIASNVVNGRWTFVAYTYDPATTNKSVYVDGALVNSGANAAPLDTFVNNPLDGLNNQSPPIGETLKLRVAAQNAPDATADVTSAPTTMTISKIRAYDVALNAQQIANDYNAEKAQFPGALLIKDVKVSTATGIITFDWAPAPGTTYTVETNSDLGNPNGWSAAASNLTGSFTNNATGSQEYYRLRVDN